MSRKLFILSTLYFIQGMPFGFQLSALPVYLRAEGVSLTGIGLAGALALPWSLKVIWGPPVDRFGSRRLGRRRSWILPLQVGLALSCAAAAFIPAESGLTALLLAVLAMNFFAATMDVAVDGLAVDVLRRDELGYGNIAQVVGYKLGMLTGGGLLLWASAWIGWKGLFLAMAGLVVVALLVTLRFREGSSTEPGAPVSPETSLRMVIADLFKALRLPSALWLLLFIATYKLGESMADTMFKPFLFDQGFDQQQIGLWVGTYGMLLSLVGSVAGGVMASRLGILRAVTIAVVLRALAVGGEWWLTFVEVTPARVLTVITAEQLFGGAVTTAVFAFMMSRVDRRIGATHFTLLATVEVTGKLIASWVSGFIADQTSYSTLFGLATGFAVAFLLLLVPLYRVEPTSEDQRRRSQTR